MSNYKYKIRDPMLAKLPDPAKRKRELELLAEYEKAGKIKRIDAVKPVDSDYTWGSADERLEELGNDDGNFRVMKIDELENGSKLK